MKLDDNILLVHRQHIGSGDVLAMPDICICRKAAISVLPNAEKERVAKSKALADLKSLNESNLNQVDVSCVYLM